MASVIRLTKQLATIPIRIVRAPFTVAKQLRTMTTESSTIGQARRAFVEDLTGRAKAMLGFVTGDDKLLTTGQIERTKAAERMTAVAEEAAADVTEQKASEEAAKQIQEAKARKAEADRKERERKAQIARETAQEQERIEVEAAKAKVEIQAEAAEQKLVIDAADSAVNVAASRELAAAEAEEIAAETARAEAEAIEKARRDARSSGRN
jgi:hypothetical protein